jgi:hypothetical protein
VKYDPQDKIAMGMLMSFAAKMEQGGAHIVDAKHPAPAGLAARMSRGPDEAAPATSVKPKASP